MKKLFLILFFFSFPILLLAQNSDEDELARQYYTLFNAKQYKEAEKTVKKLLKQNPGSLKYQLELGKVYKENGESEAAKKTYQAIISALPKEEFQIRDLANRLYQMGEYDLAIEIFLQGRKIFNNDQIFTFELLNLYRFKKDKNKLVQEYLNALSTMPQLLPQAETVFASIFEGNADYLNLQNALFKKIQKEPQNESYTKLLIWQYLQQQEYELALRQLIAQDKRIKDDGAILFEHAQIFAANKAYDTAIKAYTYLLDKGKENEYYLPSRLAMLDANYQSVLLGKNEESEITTLADQYQAILDEYGENSRTVFALRRLATISAYYLHRLPKAEKALETALTIPGISAAETGEIKLELGDIYVLSQQPWEAILKYGQVAEQFENQNIGNEAKYRSARLSFFQGNFSYAKSQLDVLKASTEQLIANDAMNLSLLLSDHLESPADTLALSLYAAAEWLQFRNLSIPALAKLDSIKVLYPQNNLADDILMAKSRIYIKNKDFTKAVPLLKELISAPQTSNWTDDAIFVLAGLYENQLNEPEQAKIWYQKLITEFPGSMFSTEARKHYRKLRGDNIES